MKTFVIWSSVVLLTMAGIACNKQPQPSEQGKAPQVAGADSETKGPPIQQGKGTQAPSTEEKNTNKKKSDGSLTEAPKTPGKDDRKAPQEVGVGSETKGPPIQFGKARQWTDSTGNFKVEAEFVESKDGKVQLKKASGSIITIPFEKLSQADQKFVREITSQQLGNNEKEAGVGSETKDPPIQPGEKKSDGSLTKDEGSLFCRVFMHLVPRNSDLSYVGAGDSADRMTYSFVPQVNETAETLSKMFGKPDRIEKAERKFYERDAAGLPSMKDVAGECWTYPPLTVMFQEGKAVHIWVEGKDALPKIAKAYEERRQGGH